MVSASCSKCHSADGRPNYVKNGEAAEEAIANGFLCTTWHVVENGDYTTLIKVAAVDFPSGESLEIGDNGNLCMTCHSGREAHASRFLPGRLSSCFYPLCRVRART